MPEDIVQLMLNVILRELNISDNATHEVLRDFSEHTDFRLVGGFSFL